MEPTTVIVIVLNVAGLVAGAVWVVAKVKASTDALSKVVDDLRKWLLRIDDDVHGNKERITIIETRCPQCVARGD